MVCTRTYVHMCTYLQSELTDSPEVYDKFLKVLMDSDDSGLTPVEVCAEYSVYARVYHAHIFKQFIDIMHVCILMHTLVSTVYA